MWTVCVPVFFGTIYIVPHYNRIVNNFFNFFSTFFWQVLPSTSSLFRCLPIFSNVYPILPNKVFFFQCFFLPSFVNLFLCFHSFTERQENFFSTSYIFTRQRKNFFTSNLLDVWIKRTSFLAWSGTFLPTVTIFPDFALLPRSLLILSNLGSLCNLVTFICFQRLCLSDVAVFYKIVNVW